MTEHTNFLEVLEHLEKHGAAKAGLLTRDLMLAMNKQQPMEFASASFGLFCFLNLIKTSASPIQWAIILQIFDRLRGDDKEPEKAAAPQLRLVSGD